MSRAEMRRQQKAQAKKNKTYVLTQEQIDKMKQDAVDEALDTSFGLMLAVPTNVLARCYWEKSATKRIPQFIDECLSLYESLGTNTVLLTEIIADVEEVAKIKLNCVERIKMYRRNRGVE